MSGHGAVAVGVLFAIMFLASFGAGTLPLAMSLSHERMNIVSSLGIGLLVGTSLGVVLPEGVEMLYQSIESAPSVVHLARQEGVSEHQPQHNDKSLHLAIAIALVLGYLVIHLLTFLPPLLLARNPRSPIPLSSLPSSPRLERVPSGTSVDTPNRLSNTTIGLCIHALADGVALGSSAVSNNIALEGIVFLAIMLHKAPASFSLTAILLHESYPRHSTKRQLLLFALSSPLSTIVTYFMLSMISLNQQNIQFWSGAILVFSVGTLIFASTNVHLHTPEEEEEKMKVKKDAIKELIAGAIGMGIPLVLDMGTDGAINRRRNDREV